MDRWHPLPVRVPADTQFLRTHLAKISELAVIDRFPVVADRDVCAERGISMAYGPDLYNLWARAAHHADRILKGTAPANLPVEQPNKFKLVINLKTANALGLTILQSLLLRADKVIG